VHRSNELRLIEFGIAAAIIVFLLLQAAYRNWRLAALAYLVLPVALMGGFVAAALNGGSISLGSIAGFFAVLTIGGRAVIQLIRHYRHLEGDEGMPFGEALVVRGSRERLGPTVMTMVATALALLPIVVRGPVAGLEFIHPAAVVILGGLVSTALLTMVVLPSLYLKFGSSPFAAPVASEERDQMVAIPDPTPRQVPVPDPTFITAQPQEQS
jgi:Cu/Ag efflux pump CusA